MSREASFFALANAVKDLPNFRGKVGVLRRLYKALGLTGRAHVVETTLRRPTPYRVRLHLDSAHELMAYLMSGYEADTVRFLLRFATPRSYLLDVGANVGLISIPFVLCARERGLRDEQLRTAVCLEPIRSNFEALKRNVELNAISGDVLCLQCAVGEREHDAAIYIEGNQKDGGNTGTANILAEDSTYECERIALRVTTIDRLVATGVLPSECGVIKLDTDGYDLFALRGATKLLEKERPVIFGEFMAGCLAWHGQTIDDVVVFARSLDYAVFARRIPEWSFVPPTESEHFSQDLLLVQAERADAVKGEMPEMFVSAGGRGS